MKMNRECRGKCKKTGKWVYGYLIYRNGKPFIFSGTYSAQSCGEDSCIYLSFYSGFIEVTPESVSQWTGKLDKNGKGKKVYKGDIFKVVYSDVPNGFKLLGREREIKEIYGVVVYKESGFYIKHKEPVNNEVRYGDLSKFLKNYKEVIGNIHDNPKLLEK